MHFHAEVWIPKVEEDLERQIDAVMEAHYDGHPGGFCDWWQIGGRWTGAHDGFDPATDERNVEACPLCNGTGFRFDEVGTEARKKDPTYTCNGCGEFNQEANVWEHGSQGPGRRVKWPTQWARHPGDVTPISSISPDLKCSALIVGDRVFRYGYYKKETSFNSKVSETLKTIGVTTGYLVTVDYHS